MSRIFSTDHKTIGRQYLVTGLVGLALGGLMAMAIRWQIARPFEPVPVVGTWLFADGGGSILPDRYVRLVTLHGSIMVFFAVTPILIGGIGNFVLPLMIGARDMCFPRLNMLSYWVFFAACAVLVGSFFAPDGSAGAGWTFYPPLSGAFSPGWGTDLWLVAIALVGVSSIMGAINFIATVLQLRAPGMNLLRMPLTVWGMFFTSILNLLWVPVVAGAIFLLLLDRNAGTAFFTPEGQPLLFQHLFWGFGHPEVYILIFPVWGIVGDLLAVFARKPAFGYRATVVSMATICAVSQIVWGHHMFTSGMRPMVGFVFMVLTIAISVPSAVFFFNWLGTLWRGSIRFEPPCLAALAVVFVFALGGLTGIFNAVRTLDVYLHETYFIVGHFHYTLAASVFFGAFAAIYYWYPKIFGREMHRGLSVAHLVLSFLLVNAVFFPMLVAGAGGMLRRTADPASYGFAARWRSWNAAATHAALALGAAQVLFAANFIGSLFLGRRAPANPWWATTLEWTVDSPPPPENFGRIPVVVRPPHDYGAPPAAPDAVVYQDAPA